jgi:glycosyltransferase involved in cell wall biosynthesis
MVSVSMITYKHEQYIQQAIEGVLMQQTDFNYELIIADDCSPDNTERIVKEIIQSHPNGSCIKYFRHEKNLGMHKNGRFASEQCQGKYIAICEGDDYWIDPLKLQKQAEFLEVHPNYGLVYSKASQYLDFEKIVLRDTIGMPFDKIDDLLICNSIPTLTVVIRKDLLNDYNEYFDLVKVENQLLGDYPIWLYLFAKTNFFFINSVTAVYRINTESASRSKNIDKQLAFAKSTYLIRLQFAEVSLINQGTRLIIENIFAYQLFKIIDKKSYVDEVVFVKDFAAKNFGFSLRVSIEIWFKLIISIPFISKVTKKLILRTWRSKNKEILF